MDKIAVMRSKFEKILSKICADNGLHYYTTPIIETKEQLTVEYRFSKYCYNYIRVAWDKLSSTFYDLLCYLKLYMTKSEMVKKDYDWRIIMEYFTKEDLKNGDVVKLRADYIGIAIPEQNVITSQYQYVRLDQYKEDLTCKNSKRLDIVSVRRPKEPRQCCLGQDFEACGELLFERKEVVEMTLEEVCKALGKEIRIVEEK